MDNTQLSKPLLGDVKSLKDAALLSTMVEMEFKPNQINPATVQVTNDKAKPDKMSEALANISVVFNSLLHSQVNVPYQISNIVKLSDETHYVASTCEGLALYIDMKTKRIDEKKLWERIESVAVLKGEQKAIFSSFQSLHEVKLPSLLPVKEKTLDFGHHIRKMVQSYDKNFLYVLLDYKKIVKVNPENFEEREDILEGEFAEMALSRTGKLATFSSDHKLTLTNLESSSQNEMLECFELIDYLEFSPNESKIIAVFWDTVFIINVNPLEKCKVLMKERVFSPVIANDENTLILGDEKGKLIFWDIKNKEQMSEVQVHSGSLNFVMLSSDGKLIYTNGMDGKLRSLKFPGVTKELSKKVWDFEISPTESNLIIKTSNMITLEKWDLSTNKTER
ncbi:unnamed protein product [Blepharisma stoltei]|uniref:WD40 repeat domain-containing protein n=1 Tax=Blepharisma stoltei TaxID=1481888 RepID=A0AAU9JCS0_9CILI|nr:unnamed protein product [Blepharisma stoltei]